MKKFGFTQWGHLPIAAEFDGKLDMCIMDGNYRI
jgi:hypothetical protein